MAENYLESLQKFRDAGGTDLTKFLDQHTTGRMTPALTPSQPSSVAAQLAAADSQTRMGITPAAGNVITNRAMNPVTAESDALEAKIAARAKAGTVIQAATPGAAPVAPAPFAPPPRRIAPEFQMSTNSIPESDTQAKPLGKKEEIPWWQRSSFEPGFQKFVNDTGGNKGRNTSLTSAPSNPQAVRNLSLMPGSFVPSSINYVDESAPDYFKNFSR